MRQEIKIPFAKTTLGEEEKKAICDVIDSGWVVMGQKTKEFEEKFAEYIGARHAIFVGSCTSALDLAVKWHKKNKDFSRDKEVIVPSLTFASSAEVLIHNGLKPDFHDVRRKDLCLEIIPNPKINGCPRPILKVHLTGNESKVGSMGGWPTIEDSAHRIERGQCKNNPNLVCFSFYATKNMTTIQGGMIATNSDAADAWLRLARDHGISKGTTERYKDGAWQYDIEFVGWREKSDDVHAAIGLEQLKKLDKINENRQRVVSRYNALLGLNRTGLHLYPILVNERAKFIEILRNRGIQCSVHFLPLHKMAAYKKYAPPEGSLPNTEYLGERLVSLPLYPQLTNEEIETITGIVLSTGLLIHE